MQFIYTFIASIQSVSRLTFRYIFKTLTELCKYSVINKSKHFLQSLKNALKSTKNTIPRREWSEIGSANGK